MGCDLCRILWVMLIVVLIGNSAWKIEVIVHRVHRPILLDCSFHFSKFLIVFKYSQQNLFNNVFKNPVARSFSLVCICISFPSAVSAL